MPTPQNLESLSVKQLITIQSQIEEFRTVLFAMVAKLGPPVKAVQPVVSFAKPTGNGKTPHRAKPRKAKTRVAIKYRDGADTWTGRGRMPRWMAAKVKQGATREQFAI